MVQTVTGEVAPDDLGFVLPHEHIYLDGFETVWSPELMLDDPKVAREELKRYLDAGGRTVVELTIHGLNPDPRALRDTAHDLGMHIVAGTGFYVEKFHPPWAIDMSVGELIDFFVRELTEGIDGTDVRAGIIGELGTGNRRVTPAEERVLRAAAVAQREVDVAITTHAPFGRIGRMQVDILEQAGADLRRVVIGHVDTTHDVDFHEELAKRGVWIGYDTIGRRDVGKDEDRADAIVEMVRRGYERQILLSSDICRRSHLHYYGGHGYDHLISGFLPILVERGIDRGRIDLLTRDNPRRMLTGAES